jgi:uncharacterized protein YjiS (DUF1127 family)
MTAFTEISRTPLYGLGFLTAPIAAFLQWNDARVTRNVLSGLSDHELDDIGLCRGDIEDVVSRR